ncbi:4a-hydroxytetrahydrobiopterin dehydratase [Virgisporangium ochraceum]|uniref:Putative pterin-4-alpha-carbinolamine dehydratase n=1 Tax=Virgisporangium ochraceum TaxID=65505 RepID=A0A8J3ZWJ4_9ACTN|nr:hypothetical protein Voc01_051690 [Virgisporangium ochraceum]
MLLDANRLATELEALPGWSAVGPASPGPRSGGSEATGVTREGDASGGPAARARGGGRIRQSPDAITRTVETESFPAAIALVNAVAEAAEAADHHPDIDIRWRTVTFSLSTHSAGGVTSKDIAMAAKINELTR